MFFGTFLINKTYCHICFDLYLASTRVSTDEQSYNAQIDELEAAGCERIYREKYSGRSKSRPELKRMIDAQRIGSTALLQRLELELSRT
ncbi:MAG: DNA invertase Pin-like site-specific DNA recombinase [Francisellaceae bacterium]